MSLKVKARLHVTDGSFKVTREVREGRLHITFVDGDNEVKVTFHPANALVLAAEILEQAPRAGKLSQATVDGLKRTLDGFRKLASGWRNYVAKERL